MTETCKEEDGPACYGDQADKAVVRRLFTRAFNSALAENERGLGHYKVTTCEEPQKTKDKGWLGLAAKVAIAVDLRHNYNLAKPEDARKNSITQCAIAALRIRPPGAIFGPLPGRAAFRKSLRSTAGRASGLAGSPRERHRRRARPAGEEAVCGRCDGGLHDQSQRVRRLPRRHGHSPVRISRRPRSRTCQEILRARHRRRRQIRARARAGRAFALYGLANLYALPAKILPSAQTDAKIAVRDAPDSAEAQLAAALLQTWFVWDFEAGRKAFEEAVRLDPLNSTIRRLYGDYFLANGNLPNAMKEKREALGLSPRSAAATVDVGNVFFYQKNYDQALAQADAALALKPDMADAYELKAWVYTKRNQYDEALEALRAAERRLEGEMPRASALSAPSGTGSAR